MTTENTPLPGQLETIFPPSRTAKRLATKTLRAYAKTLRRPPAFPPPGDAAPKILILSHGGIGNTLMATPLIAAAREMYPNARIDVLTSPGAAVLLATNPHASNVIADQDGDDIGLAAYWRINRILRKGRYDAALSTVNATTFRFAVRPVLARIPIRVIHAYAFHPNDDYTTAFTHRIPHVTDEHDCIKNLNLLRAISGEVADAGPLVLGIPSDKVAGARRALGALGWTGEGKTVGLCSGSSTWMAFKRWPHTSYVRLARMLIGAYPDLRILAFCGPEEAAEAEAWKREFDDPRLIPVQGLDLMTYAGALTCCDATVVNDSLALHICAARQVPTVALYGPTSPAQTGPWKCRSTIVTPQGGCEPFCRFPYTPNPAHFPDYMAAISPDEVMDQVSAILRV